MLKQQPASRYSRLSSGSGCLVGQLPACSLGRGVEPGWDVRCALSLGLLLWTADGHVVLDNSECCQHQVTPGDICLHIHACMQHTSKPTPPGNAQSVKDTGHQIVCGRVQPSDPSIHLKLPHPPDFFLSQQTGCHCCASKSKDENTRQHSSQGRRQAQQLRTLWQQKGGINHQRSPGVACAKTVLGKPTQHVSVAARSFSSFVQGSAQQFPASRIFSQTHGWLPYVHVCSKKKTPPQAQAPKCSCKAAVQHTQVRSMH